MNRAGLVLCIAAASCGRCGREPLEVPPLIEDGHDPGATIARRDAGSASRVHAYPPHAIRNDGVGPYLLGEDLKQVMSELPEGPRLELLQIGRYANWRMARAEDDAIIIGADDENRVEFVSVLAPQVARTSAGVGVGATGAELEAALGPALEQPGLLRDRRIFQHAALPRARFLTQTPIDEPPESATVVGVIVARPDPEPTDERRAACAAGPFATTTDDILAAARKGSSGSADARRRVAGGCITGAAPEAAVLGAGELVLIGGEGGKLRRLAVVAAADARLFGVLDAGADGREEIILGTQQVVEGEHFVEVRVLRWEGGKLVEALVDRPYALRAGAAAFAGVAPADVDLALEARVVHGELRLGGFYTARGNGKLRGLAPLAPVKLDVGKRGPVSEPKPTTPDAPRSADAPAPDAGSSD